MCRDHESLNLQQFEGLMALTNLASLDNVKSRIVAEKGISCFQYLQVQQMRVSRSWGVFCSLPGPATLMSLIRLEVSSVSIEHPLCGVL